MIWYQRLNPLSDYHEIRYKISLKKLSSKLEFCENWLRDSHSVARCVNKFLQVFYILDQCG